MSTYPLLQRYIDSFKYTPLLELPQTDNAVMITTNRTEFRVVDAPDGILFPKSILIARKKIISSDDLFNLIIGTKLNRYGYLTLFHKFKQVGWHEDILIVKQNKFVYICGPLTPINPNLSAIHELGLREAGKVIHIKFLDYTTSSKGKFVTLSEVQSHPETVDIRRQVNWEKGIHSTSGQYLHMPHFSQYLSLIWWERDESRILRSFQKLIYTSIHLVQTNFDRIFGEYVKGTFQKKELPMDDNFIIGLSGGYARGEFGKYSDVDLVLIHEGKDMNTAGSALDYILSNVYYFNLCNWHNLNRLNFHRTELQTLVHSVINGEISLHSFEVKSMIEGIEMLRNLKMEPHERKKSISKYYWSLLKGVLDVYPVYEQPIGLAQKLRDDFYETIRSQRVEFVKAIYQFDAFMNDDLSDLLERFDKAKPETYDDIFKSHSGIITIQDIGTLLAIFGDFPIMLNETTDRLKVAIDKGLISEDIGCRLMEIYFLLRKMKYLDKSNLPLEALREMSLTTKELAKQVYQSWMKQETNLGE